MDLTYTSLGGSSAGCVDFFGISIISEPPAPMQSFRASRDQAREFVLVSEYANAGNIRDFLRGEFPKCSFQESWILVVQMLLGIATGIHTLHAHGVIHR
jgi:serine/threonine protein kinase